MEQVYECCCGLDVHKKLIVACLLKGNEQAHIRQFATTTDDIQEFAQWLVEHDCQMVAMESTASYWKPVYNLLEAIGINAISNKIRDYFIGYSHGSTDCAASSSMGVRHNSDCAIGYKFLIKQVNNL